MIVASSRRTFLKTGSAALVYASLPREALPLPADRPPRVGIIGGGLAGVSCAWLLDGVAEAVLFESRQTVGGHAHTIPVVAGNQEVLVDVGAQFFARGPHPTYVKLLELIGLFDPNFPEHDASLEAEMSIAVMEKGRIYPRFLSPATGRFWPVFAPWNYQGLWAFLWFALGAKEFAEHGDWDVLVGSWLKTLPIREEDRERLLLPLMSAMVGCSIEQARQLSARGALAFVGKALPESLLAPFKYSNSLLGLGGNVQFLAQLSQNLTVHLGSNVTRVRRSRRGGFRIRNASGVEDNVDVVIFATPPYITSSLLAEIPRLSRTARVLRSFEYFPSEISVHRDPVYMPEDPWYWSAYNISVENAYSEASVWYGALRPVQHGQTPLPLFKSWATARSKAPEQEVFRRQFLHPLLTPGFVRAQRRLAAYQGRAGIWFAGSYTRDVDSQESALVSAMNVVRELAPTAPNLLELAGLMEAVSVFQRRSPESPEKGEGA